MPPTTLSNYEVGPNKVPASLLPALAAALDASYEELLGEVPNPSAAHRTKVGRPRLALVETAARDSTISDRVTERLLAAWEDVSPAELAIVEELAETAERLRRRLLREEHGLVMGATGEGVPRE